MDIIEHFWVSRLLSRNFQVSHNVPKEAHMTQNNTRMLYGDDIFLSTILLKLSGAVNGHFWTLSCLFCNKVAIFMQIGAPMEAHMAQNNTEMCLWWWNVLSSILLKHPSPINRVLHINQSRHFRHSNAAFLHHRTKVWWTIQDILWHT